MGAFADVLVLLLMLCIEQRTVEFFCEDMQKFSIEVDSNYAKLKAIQKMVGLIVPAIFYVERETMYSTARI